MDNPGMSNLKHNLDVIQQKARERTVKTQNSDYDLDTLIKRIDNGTIKLDPDYQRRHRWSDETSSRLIESLILNIPIPVIFISQDVDVDDEISASSSSRFTVIDGQQRLTAIYCFMKNKLALSGLDTLKELNGAYYKDLPPFLIRRLEERTIRCLRIDSTVDPQVKFDIFERLNTGSIKLESQELRNATVRGPFNDRLKNLAMSNDFRQLIQVDPSNSSENNKVKKMEDIELALRFFALRFEGTEKIKKGFKDFLTTSLSEFNKLDIKIIDERCAEFDEYMSFILRNLGSQAFSKWRSEGDSLKKMSSFNAAVFDAVAVGLSKSYTVNELKQNEERIGERLRGFREALFPKRSFFEAVSGSVNDVGKVETRINEFSDFIKI